MRGVRFGAVTGTLALAASLVVTAVAVPAGAAAEPLIATSPRNTSLPNPYDGDPATTERLVRGAPTSAALEVSQLRFANALGVTGRKAAHVVLSREDTFADSLAGTPLSQNGPLLYTATGALSAETSAEIDRVLLPGGRIYLLGGPKAVGPAVASSLSGRGYEVVRLAGPSRVETAIAAADEVRRLYGRTEVLLARAYGTDGNPSAAWADSASAGGLAAAAGVPVVITATTEVHPALKAWFSKVAPTRTVVLGGPNALSTAVQAATPNAVRVSGADRTATATAIATQAWGKPVTGARNFVVVNGEEANGWAFAFAAAGLSSDARAPILLTTWRVSPAVRAVAGVCGAPEVETLIVGDGQRVSGALRERLDALDGRRCGPDNTITYRRGLTAYEGCDDILGYFQELALERVGPYGLNGGPVYTSGPQPTPVAEGDPAAAPSAPGADGGGFSGTNNQELGVDEPDIVKNDGTRAFIVAQGSLQLLDLSAATPRLASTVELPAGEHELLRDGNTLLVLSRTYGYATTDGPQSFAPYYEPTTTLSRYNVSDLNNPVLTATIAVDGDYRSARFVGGVVRVVVQTPPRGLVFTYPEDGSDEAQERAAEHNRQVIRDSVVENWVSTYTARNGNGQVVSEDLLVDCAATHEPPRQSALGTLSVFTLDLAGGGLEPTSSAAIAAYGDTVYASASRLFVATGRWNGWTADPVDDLGSTELHGFDISVPTATTYVASGVATGWVLNQFALSEHEGFLRVAGTDGAPWGNRDDSSSHVTVFEERGAELVQVGRVDGLGKGETIQAVRFLGDLAAVVTFRQTDPLYLLDLSVPTAPRVTGELKITGFSTYLHPIGSNHLLGIGRDADAEGRVLGAQAIMVDISDRANPRVSGKLTWPDASSEVEYDHRAFLYWAPANLAVMPLYEYNGNFQGAQGMTVTTAGTLAARGRHEHPATSGGQEWHPTVRRSFVIGSTLFTVSDGGVLTASMTTLAPGTWTPFPDNGSSCGGPGCPAPA